MKHASSDDKQQSAGTRRTRIGQLSLVHSSARPAELIQAKSEPGDMDLLERYGESESPVHKRLDQSCRAAYSLFGWPLIV